MNCEQTRDWLLRSDDPRSTAPVADHLAGCDACRSVATELAQLEQSYRSLPAPAEADSAQATFLRKLPGLEAPPRRRWNLPRWAAAAVLLLGLGAAAWFLFAAPEAQAAPALIERLVDWNVELANATPAERAQLYSTSGAAFKQEIGKAQLAPPERELAGLLLDNGTWLAEHDDPVAAAERFSAVADKLVEHMETASERRDIKLANRYAQLQGLVVKRGISENLKKAEDSGALNFDNQRRLEKVVLRDKDRMKQLLDLLEKNPDISRKEIRKALDIQPKNPKPTAKNKG